MVLKTDNSRIKTKLGLRRYFLDRYHGDGDIRVFDACQGTGLIWRHLAREYKLTRYWGVDKREKRGRLAVDSARILGQPGLQENVIDIDTYGLPWKHYAALLQNINEPTTVFLTIGFVAMMGGGGRSSMEAAAFGMSGQLLELCPPGLLAKLHKHSLSYCLTSGCDHDTLLIEAAEGFPRAPHARYIGVRLQPA